MYGSVHFKITHYMTEFIEIIKNFLFFVNLNKFAKFLIHVFNLGFIKFYLNIYKLRNKTIFKQLFVL